jgi:hypothetical protein
MVFQPCECNRKKKPLPKGTILVEAISPLGSFGMKASLIASATAAIICGPQKTVKESSLLYLILCPPLDLERASA